jgi:hypothetical protein
MNSLASRTAERPRMAASSIADAAPEATQVNRWFWRCLDCCSLVAIEHDFTSTIVCLEGRVHASLQALRCECDGAMTLVGRVRQDRLERIERRCACDARCTNAAGHLCNCLCGGKNHGTAKVICTRVDAGGIPRVRGADINAAREFRAAVKAARERISKFKWGPRIRHAETALRRATEYHTHRRRMAALARVAS